MKTTLETAMWLSAWANQRLRGNGTVELNEQAPKILDEFLDGKLIILRTGGEVSVRSVD